MVEVFIAKSGKESGPFTPEQLPSMVESGMLSLTDSIWHSDLPGWVPVHQYLNVRPPVPAAVPVPTVVELPVRSGEPAGFGRRLGASAVDAGVVFVIGSIILGILIEILFGDSARQVSEEEGGYMVLLPVMVIGWIYSAAMESGPLRATVGKLVFALVVADKKGSPVDFWQASKRYAGKLLAIPTFGLTLVPSVWTRRRQNVHDLLSNTLVLRK